MRHPAAPSHPTAPGHPTPSHPAASGHAASSKSAASRIRATPPSVSINKDRDRDLYECERESAFAGAGDKRQAFDKCMKARGY